MQVSLFDYKPRARATDPEPSHVAAELARHFVGDHHRKILAFLQRIEPKAAHYIEIADGCGMEKHQVGRRLKELREAGYIFKSGNRPLAGTNRSITAYRIAGKGAEAAA